MASVALAERQAHAALTAWASIVNGCTIKAMPRATNTLWRVDGVGPTLVLKQLPEYPVGVAPVVEFRVLAHLQRHRVPVTLPIPTDTTTLHATVEGRHWTLLPFVPHQPTHHELGPHATANAFAVGAAIGHLDRALADYPWAVDSFVDDPSKTLSEAIPELPAEVTQLVRPFADRLSNTCTGLPVQLTHGDCNDGNVLIDEGQVVGFIDIDHLPMGPKVRDLAYYLASRLRTHLVARESADESTTAMAAVLGDYVAGYHQADPLIRQEILAIVPLMLLTEISGAHWALHGWEPSIDRYQRLVQSITWITSRFDALTQAAETPSG